MIKKRIFKANQKGPGIKANTASGDNQPPKNKIEHSALITKILEYSPNENNAKAIAEYSTL